MKHRISRCTIGGYSGKAYYTPAEAAEITGASKPVLRIYTNTYARHFSTEATPEAGQPRKFTAADLRLIAFIRQRTAEGLTHETVLAQLAAGDLNAFDWAVPGENAAHDSEQTALAVPIERLQAAQALLADARQREESAQSQIQVLQDEVRRLTLDLGKAQGALEERRRRKPPKWWSMLFGGER